MGEDKIEVIIEKLNDSSSKFEKSFAQYIVAGSGASVGVILSFYQATIFNDKALISFDIPLWLFTISLVLGTLQFAYISFISSKQSVHGFIINSQIKELATKIEHEDVVTTKNDLLLEFQEIQTRQNSFKQKNRIFRTFYIINSVVASSCFILGLGFSMYVITGLT